jgi:hypothetical protein
VTDATGVPLHFASTGADRHGAPLLSPKLGGLDTAWALPADISVHLDRVSANGVTRALLDDLGFTGRSRIGDSRPGAGGETLGGRADAGLDEQEWQAAPLYPTLLPAHIVLVPDLQNPTGLRALAASREILARYGYLSLHETVLGILGSATMGREHAEPLLASCADAFESARGVITTPFLGDTMVTDIARPMTIDGAQELITAGFFREAVFWIAVVHI